MINELQVISTAKTKRARQLVLNYLLSQGIPFGDIKYYDNEDGWTICLRKYESIDSYSFKLSDSYPSAIDVTKDRILVSEVKVMSKKPDKIKPLLWVNDYLNNDIGSMLSDYSKSSLYPKPKYPNMPSWGESAKQYHGIFGIMKSNEGNLYVVDRDIQKDVCEYIMNLTSLIRDEKINSLLDDKGNT